MQTQKPAEILIKTPTPHGTLQNIIFNAFLTAGLTSLWVACGTKFGKTLAGSSAIAAKAPIAPDSIFRWVAPYQRQADIGARIVRKILPPEPFTTFDKQQKILKIPQQDCQIEFWNGNDPEALEGEGVNGGYVLDEASKLKRQVFDSARTTTTLTRAPFVIISTPRGKNWFWRGCMDALEEMERARHEGRPPRHIFITAPTSANPFVPRESIAEAKLVLPDRLFRQYYLAEFLDDGAVFRFLADAMGGVNTEYQNNQKSIVSEHRSRDIYIGADWAKQHDSTVFYAINDRGENIGYERFNKIPYTEQVGRLIAFCDDVQGGSTADECNCYVLHDQTGVGEAIEDIIDAVDCHGHSIDGIRWNNYNKEQIVNEFILSLEERCLKLLPWLTLKNEGEAFELNTTLSGKATFSAPIGEHDDAVMAAICANHLYRENRGDNYSVAVVDQIKNQVNKIQFSTGLDDFF